MIFVINSRLTEILDICRYLPKTKLVDFKHTDNLYLVAAFIKLAFN